MWCRIGTAAPRHAKLPRVTSSHAFLTTWLLDAEREDVWDALWDSERWPEWWRGVTEAVETDPGTPCGIGRRGSYEWRGRIPYPVRFSVVTTAIERPWLLEGEASGDLAGIGRWEIHERDGLSVVTYAWTVAVAKPWMRAAGPLVAPVFRWNHDQVMRWGGKGLARHLGCRLVEPRNE